MRSSFFAAAAIVIALALPASADHCATWSTSTPDIFDRIDVPSVAGYYYDDDLPCEPDCVWGIWIYQESNGIPGLQRGDEVVDDTCHSMIPADTIVF